MPVGPVGILVEWIAPHVTGIFGDSRENSNGAVHPGGTFSGKKLIPFEVFLFCRLYRCTVPFGAKFSLVFPVKWKEPQESGIGLQLGFSLNLLEHIPGTCLHISVIFGTYRPPNSTHRTLNGGKGEGVTR